MYRILVVDDEAKIRLLIRKYAEFEGHEVTEAENGMEAAARGEEEPCVQALTRLFKLNELGAPTHCEIKNNRRHARK